MRLKIEEYYIRVPSILMNGIIKKFENAFDVPVGIKTLDNARGRICNLSTEWERKVSGEEGNLKFEK